MTGPAFSVTFDLEDHRPSPTWEARYEQHCRQLLDFCDERGITATVFVVGRVAERSPALVQEVAARGHELGIHNYEHWPLFSCTPAWLAEKVKRAKGFVEDLTGAPVEGFRAPAGTLVPRTFWVTEVLAALGFTYSASVLPFQAYAVGFPGCPAVPFRWPSGLIEAPCPAVGLGPVGLPFMGGTFLRVLPGWLSRRFAGQLPADLAPWTYLHPYDLDVMERFWWVHDVPPWGSFLLWINRGSVLAKLGAVLDGRETVALGRRLAALDAAGRIERFDPTAAPDPAADVRPPHPALGALQRYLRKDDKVGEWLPPVHLQPGELTGVLGSDLLPAVAGEPVGA